MSIPRSPDGTWEEYFDACLTKPLHPLYRELDKYLPPSGHAYELGCGVGHGAMHLLSKGFSVTAVDINPTALMALERRLPEGAPVELVRSSIEELEMKPCDVVVAGFALFFLAPDDLRSFWSRLQSALKPGGLFMGDFLGERDQWAAEGFTSLTGQQVEGMLSQFDLLHFEEVERDGFTVQGTPKHWHVFHVIARRR